MPDAVSRTWSEIRLALFIVAFIVVLRSSVFGHYVIPSGSMQPTLKINDHVVANKLAYGLTLPFMDEMVAQWSRPSRGEVVILTSKESGVTLIKRIVGLGGDTISFRNGVLAVNGVVSQEQLLQDRTLLSDLGEPADDKDLYLETPPDGAPPHPVLRQKSGGATEQEGRDFIVPLGEVFLLGDNRDGSHDSRAWGTISELKLLGRAWVVAYSTHHHSSSFWPIFRAGRFFLTIQ